MTRYILIYTGSYSAIFSGRLNLNNKSNSLNTENEFIIQNSLLYIFTEATLKYYIVKIKMCFSDFFWLFF